MRKIIKPFVALFCLWGIFSASAILLPKSQTGAVPIRVACVGDSITFGVGVTNRARQAYPAVLGRMLGPQYDVRNFGVSARTMLKAGDHPYWIEQAFTNALDFKPDILVILLGTNDSKHPTDQFPKAPDNWRHHDEFAANYEEMIADFRRANPAVKAYVCLPPPAFPGRWGITEFTMTNAVAPLVCQVAQATGATVIDLHTPLAAHPEMFPDTVHPNPAGAKLMAATVYQALTGKPAPNVDPPSAPDQSSLKRQPVGLEGRGAVAPMAMR